MNEPASEIKVMYVFTAHRERQNKIRDLPYWKIINMTYLLFHISSI